MRIHFRACAIIVLLSGCQSARTRPHQPGPQAEGSQWPLLVDRLPDLDTLRVVTVPPDTFEWYRTDISLSFKPDVTDSVKVLFFERHAMRVLGVTQVGRFFVRIPDPGPTMDALRQVVETLRREPEIARASPIPRSALQNTH